MFKKIVASALIILSSSTFASHQNNGMIKIINNIKVPQGLNGIVQFKINGSKKNVYPDGAFTMIELASHTLVQFDVVGMIFGNTYQTNVSSNCHFQLLVQEGKTHSIEIHSPPDDEPGFGRLITCIIS